MCVCVFHLSRTLGLLRYMEVHHAFGPRPHLEPPNEAARRSLASAPPPPTAPPSALPFCCPPWSLAPDTGARGIRLVSLRVHDLQRQALCSTLPLALFNPPAIQQREACVTPSHQPCVGQAAFIHTPVAAVRTTADFHDEYLAPLWAVIHPPLPLRSSASPRPRLGNLHARAGRHKGPREGAPAGAQPTELTLPLFPLRARALPRPSSRRLLAAALRLFALAMPHSPGCLGGLPLSSADGARLCPAAACAWLLCRDLLISTHYTFGLHHTDPRPAPGRHFGAPAWPHTCRRLPGGWPAQPSIRPRLCRSSDRALF